MGVQVSFDWTTFAVRYPELAQIGVALGQAYFNEACLYHDNSGRGPPNDAGQQLLLLNMLVAHVAQLNAPLNGQAPTPIVGRIASATEGSTTVQVQYDATNPEKWFSQTKYGASYWQATSFYRGARYAPGPTRNFNPWLFGPGNTRF